MLEREFFFVKDYMAGNINTAGGNMKAFIPFVSNTVDKENTWKRAINELVGIISTNVWKTFTAKNFEKIIIRFFMKKNFIRAFIFENWSRQPM